MFTPEIEPTTEVIAAAKKQHGELFKIKAKSGRYALLKAPDIKILDAAMVAGRNGGLGMARTLFSNCVLWQSPGLTQADLISIYTKVPDVIDIEPGEMEKL